LSESLRPIGLPNCRVAENSIGARRTRLISTRETAEFYESPLVGES